MVMKTCVLFLCFFLIIGAKEHHGGNSNHGNNGYHHGNHGDHHHGGTHGGHDGNHDDSHKHNIVKDKRRGIIEFTYI